MSRFYIERVQKARLCTDRTFHFLVSLYRLATWSLGPKPSVKALAHEITVRRRKFFFFGLLLSFFVTNVLPFRNGDDEREQRQGGDGRGSQVGGAIPTSSSNRRKTKKYIIEGWFG